MEQMKSLSVLCEILTAPWRSSLNGQVPFKTLRIAAAILALPLSAALAVDVPYSDNFNNYANGAMPANFDGNNSDWFISTDGSAGVFRGVLGVFSGEKSSSSSIALAKPLTDNFTISTKIKVNRVIGPGLHTADIALSIPGSPNLKYIVADPVRGNSVFFDVYPDATFSRGFINCTAECTVTVHSALVDDTVFLTGTFRNEFGKATVTRTIAPASRNSADSFFAYNQHIHSGQVNRGATMEVSYDDFSIVFETLPPKLGNISTRLVTGADDKVAIAGFVVQGNQPKKVLVRAQGGEMFNGYVTNPTLELHGFNGRLIGFNDNWTDSQGPEISGTGLAPSHQQDAALIATLDPRGYTVVVRGNNGETGRVIVEVFDITDGIVSTLANLSTRGQVGAGDDVMIAGVIPLGDLKTRVVIRALGPSLQTAGVTGTIMDPILELHDRNGALVMTNDNWRDSQRDAITATGLAPTDDREAALIADLLPAGYTAIVRGKNETTGIGLVEIYHLK